MTQLVIRFRGNLAASHAAKNFLSLFTQVLLLTIGAVISGASVVLFLIPSSIAPGGLSGIAIILNEMFRTPVGLVTLLLNLPIMVMGYYMLGGWRVMAGTIYFIILFSLSVDLLTPFLPPHGITDNHLLNAIFSGIFSGFSGGLVFRLGVTAGGTTILTRILNMRFGVPISNATLLIDGLIVAVSGLVFGWESAMYAIISLGVYGVVCDYVLEGPSVIRTVTIITDHPHEVSDLLLNTLHRGVTAWEAEGMFTEQRRSVLFITVLRSQVTTLRQLVRVADPEAFVVISQGHVAYGKGFRKNTDR